VGCVVEFLLVLVGILLAITTGASIEYYRQIRKAQKEYQKARDAVEDIVLSFNRQLRREAEGLEALVLKVEGMTAKVDTSIKKADDMEKKFAPMMKQLSDSSGSSERVLSKMAEIDKRSLEIAAAQEALQGKVSEVEQQFQKLVVAPEIKSEPVIPIRRDKAMAALTETELNVLEMLTAEGSKTAPEIKDMVRLSREHTARLMKKLYEKGYLERETGKIPFSYSIKKEMKKILRKAESEQV
jgi:DNA-binding CsgD family transcriptional regulator